MKKKTLVLSLAVMPFALMACGDDVTEITEVNNSYMAVLKSGEKLSKQPCDTTNVGEMLYVKDSASTFVCDGDEWTNLKGKDGENGKSITVDGGKGEVGNDGSSCSAKKVTKDKRVGYELSCGENVIDTLWNGVDGQNGKGENGIGCTAKQVKKGKLVGYELTCNNAVVDTIWNGKDGKDAKASEASGCKVVSDEGGVVTFVCGEGETADTTKVFKATCGSAPYDPETNYCKEGVISAFGKLTDDDGHVYKTVTVGYGDGAPVWMAENLNREVEGQSWCYGDKEENCEKYGRLYTWAAAVGKTEECNGGICQLNDTVSGVQGICPDGWHLPTKMDWARLYSNIGGNDFAALKLRSSDGWSIGHGADAVGFDALPGGYRNSEASYSDEGDNAYFWAYEHGESYAYYVQLGFLSSKIILNGYKLKSSAMSVRCVLGKRN